MINHWKKNMLLLKSHLLPASCLQPRAKAQGTMKTFWMKQWSTRLPDVAAGQLAPSSSSSSEDTALQEWGRELCVLSLQDTQCSLQGFVSWPHHAADPVWGKQSGLSCAHIARSHFNNSLRYILFYLKLHFSLFILYIQHSAPRAKTQLDVVLSKVCKDFYIKYVCKCMRILQMQVNVTVRDLRMHHACILYLTTSEKRCW